VQRIASAEAALSVLTEKKMLAERACQEHNAAVSEAIGKVILVEQDRIALRMTKAREVMCEAHDSLKHLSMVWIPKPSRSPINRRCNRSHSAYWHDLNLNSQSRSQVTTNIANTANT
jgi:hypothetical protein